MMRAIEIEHLTVRLPHGAGFRLADDKNLKERPVSPCTLFFRNQTNVFYRKGFKYLEQGYMWTVTCRMRFDANIYFKDILY